MTARSKAARCRAAKRELAEVDGKRPRRRTRGGTFAHVESVARSLTTAGRRRVAKAARTILDTVSGTIAPRVAKLCRGIASKRHTLLAARGSGAGGKG